MCFSLEVPRPWAATAEPAGEDSHHSATLAFAQDLITGEGLGLSPSGRGCVLCVETDGSGCVGGQAVGAIARLDHWDSLSLSSAEIEYFSQVGEHVLKFTLMDSEQM